MTYSSGADPDRIGTREDLARELTALRSAAGLTVRDLARRLDAPTATLGDYFAGRHLPNSRQIGLYRQLLAECGVTDRDRQESWVAALIRARSTSDGRAGKSRPPYRGMEPFGEGDAEIFFGRRDVLAELLARLRALRAEHPGDGEALALVGPSGSGKSSLLMAGLLPAIRAGELGSDPEAVEVRCLTPEQVSTRLAAELRSTAGPRPVIIVDQVEEALTAPPDERARLLQLIGGLQRHATVVFGLRADFYSSAASEAVLLPALRRNQVLLGPMTADELRAAVLGPADRAGTVLEEGLVELVLSDLAPGSPPGFAHEPGALPLLSYALLATWERAPRNQLTIADYRGVGGLHGAISQAAERLYSGLDPSERDTARSLFSRLVRVDADGPPTRRRASRSSLTETGDPDRDYRSAAVLERFVAARLLTADASAVQISHEALVRAWPRLGEWVNSDRDWLVLHDQLAGATEEWQRSSGDDSLLWTGARLATALEHVGRPGREVSQAERRFLTRSAEVRNHKQEADRRRARRNQQLLAAVAVLAAAAIVFAVLAVNARDGALRTRDQALSRQVALEARQLAPTDPSLAAQLALASYRISPTVEARSALIDATAGEIPTRLLGPIGPDFLAAGASGRILAVAQSATDTVEIYNQSTDPPTRLAQMQLPAGAQDFAVALSPDGRLLAAGGTSDHVQLWDLTDPARPRPLATLGGFSSTVYSLAFSPGGRRIAGADADGTVHRFDLSPAGHPVAQPLLRMPAGGPAKAVAFSPDGRRLAVAGTGGQLAVWDGSDPRPSVAPPEGTATLESVTFSPDGRRLAAGDANGRVDDWDISAGGQLTAAGSPPQSATTEINAVAFSPSGTILATGAADGSIQLYDTSSWKVIATLKAPNPVTSVLFEPGGHRLVTGDSGGVTRLWSVPVPASYREPGRIFVTDFTPHGRDLYVGTSGTTGGVDVWSVASPAYLTDVAAIHLPAGFGPLAGSAALNPAGTLLAAADSKPAIQLFRVAAPSTAVPVGRPLIGNRPLIEQLGFAPDGKLLASSDDSGQVRLWDVTDPSRPRALPSLDTGNGEVLGFAISSDSRLLAAASTDGKVHIYDIADPARPALLSTVGGFSSYAYDAAFTPDGRTLIAGSADGTVRLWNVTDPGRPRLLGGPLTGPTGDIFQVAVSPDGRYLAAGSTNQAVWIWDISDPARPRLNEELQAARDEVFSVQFSPNGQSLVAAGSARTLYLWRYRAAAATQMVCSHAGDPITRSEWARYIQGAPYRAICP